MNNTRTPSARDIALAEVKARVDCAAVAQWLGLKRTREANKWTPCPSPGCGRHNLSIPPGRGWLCFDCGAKGDAFHLVMQVEGVDFAGAVNRLCALYGVAIDGKVQPFSDEDAQIVANIRANAQQPKPPPEPEFPATAWWQSHAVNAAPALALLNARGIPHADTRTPFVDVKTEATKVLPYAQRSWASIVVGDIAAAPMRNMRTGVVEGLHLRAIEPQANKDDKQRTVNSKKDHHKTPRGFGVMTNLVAAHTVLLCEGLLDTLAAEALVHGVEGVAVVGGSGASELPKLAAYLAREAPSARVVICYHVDDAGRKTIGEVRKHIPSAVKFKWEALARALPPVAAMLEKRGLDAGVDVCDILTAMQEARTPITTMHGHLAQTRFAFAASCGLQRSADGPPQ